LSWGSDIALDNNRFTSFGFLNPYEAGLEYTVDLDQKADFIGKKALERVAAEGPTRKVVGIELDCEPLIGYIEDFLPVVDGTDQIGQVSSAFYSPRLKKNIGFALVPIDRAGLGTNFILKTARGEREATVVQMPFVDPEKSTPKG